MSEPTVNGKQNNDYDLSQARIGTKKDAFKQDARMVEIFNAADTNKNGVLDNYGEVSVFQQKSAQMQREIPKGQGPLKPKDVDISIVPQSSGAKQRTSASAAQHARPKQTAAEKYDKQGRHISSVMYEEIEDTFTMGGVDTEEFQQALKQMTPNNVMQTLSHYQKLSKGESLIDAINSEYSDSEDIRKSATMKIYDNLMAKAESVGVDKNNLEAFKNQFETELRIQYREIGTVDSSNMDNIINGIVQSINNAGTVSKAERQQIQAKDGNEQRQDAVGFLTRKANSASKAFQAQQNHDGWAGKTVDWMSGLWSSDNRAHIVQSDINKYQSQINSLNAAQKQGQAAFDNKFYQTFGVDFDPVQMAAYKKKEEQFSVASACYGVETQFNNTVGNLIKSPILKNEQDVVTTPEGASFSRTIATKEQVYEREVKNFATFIGKGNEAEGKKQLDLALKNAGINPQKATMDEKYKALSGFAKQYSKTLHQHIQKATGGKTYQQISNEFDNSYTATFGAKNDLARRVSKYNASQEAGANFLKASTITVGATIIAVVTGGTGLVPLLASAGGSAALSFTVNASDRATSQEGLSLDQAKTYAKAAIVDGATNIVSGGTSQVLKNTGAGIVTRYAVQTGVDTGADMAAEYINNGEITLENTLVSAVSSIGGQVLENALDAKKYDLGEVSESAATDLAMEGLDADQARHTIHIDDALGVNNSAMYRAGNLETISAQSDALRVQGKSTGGTSNGVTYTVHKKI